MWTEPWEDSPCQAVEPLGRGGECLINGGTDGEADLEHHPFLFKEVPTGPKATKLGRTVANELANRQSMSGVDQGWQIARDSEEIIHPLVLNTDSPTVKNKPKNQTGKHARLTK